jgi:AcrR family transcriptional regulator
MSPRSKEANQLVLDLRREQFIAAAFKIFACRGYAATRISDIAAAAGMSHGLIYHYFKTKEEVFAELVKSASNVFLAVTKYGSRYDASPLDKLRIIAEIVISMSHSEESTYYLNIVEQALVSEGIAETTKKIIVKNVASSIQLIQSLILEGQKRGQIIFEDPQKLALAYFSMVKGMSGMQSKIDAFHDFTASFSDGAIIVRALENPECRQSKSLDHRKTSPFAPLKPVSNTLVYRTRINEKKEATVHRESVTRSVRNGKDVFRIVTEQESGERMVALINAGNLLPIRIEFRTGNEKANHWIDYKDDRVIIHYPQRGIHKELQWSGRLYDNYTVPHILQSYPFESVDKMQLLLIMDGIFGWPVGLYGIEIMNAGRETVRSPAGEYDCYRLELSNPVFDKIKIRYWFPVDAPRYYVRRELLGSVTELVEIQ